MGIIENEEELAAELVTLLEPMSVAWEAIRYMKDSEMYGTGGLAKIWEKLDVRFPTKPKMDEKGEVLDKKRGEEILEDVDGDEAASLVATGTRTVTGGDGTVTLSPKSEDAKEQPGGALNASSTGKGATKPVAVRWVEVAMRKLLACGCGRSRIAS